MNQTELWAYGQVAEALTKHAYISALDPHPYNWPATTQPAEPVYYHQCNSAFEWTAQSLWRLGILKNYWDGKPSLPTHSIFTCDPAEAHVVAMKNWKSGPNLNELVENFIYTIGQYGPEYWGLSTEPNTPFGKGGRLESTLDALANIGYLDKTSDGFVWTHVVAEFMYRWGYWPNPNGKATTTR